MIELIEFQEGVWTLAHSTPYTPSRRCLTQTLSTSTALKCSGRWTKDHWESRGVPLGVPLHIASPQESRRKEYSHAPFLSIPRARLRVRQHLCDSADHHRADPAGPGHAPRGLEQSGRELGTGAHRPQSRSSQSVPGAVCASLGLCRRARGRADPRLLADSPPEGAAG